MASNRYDIIKNVFFVLAVLVLGIWHIYTGRSITREQQNAIKTLIAIQPNTLTSFKIHPEKTYTDDYHDAIEFPEDARLVMEFFQACATIKPYSPQHDVGLAQWGMQIRTKTAIVRVACHIPDHKPGVVAGTIFSDSGSGDFQSRLLLRWYQKYGHYWKVGGYQKVQYSRVKPILKSISPEGITSFRIVPGVLESSTSKETNEFSQDAELVTEFFQALEDMQFAAPKYKKLVDQWNIQIRTGTTTLNVECSIPAEDPTVVVGLIDSDAGYSYFQSRKVFQWYQTYKDRWLNPPAAPE
jgi:hypothetical protein